jgi:hypothetical protein
VSPEHGVMREGDRPPAPTPMAAAGAPATEPVSTEAVPSASYRPFNPIDAAIGVLTRPAGAMREIAAARPWRTALILDVVIGLLSALSNVTGPTPGGDEDSLGPVAGPVFEPLMALAQSPAGWVFQGLVLGPAFLAIGAGVLLLFGRLLGGRGSYPAVLATQAFASVPFILLAPLTSLLNLAGRGVIALGGALDLGFIIWALVLAVIGLRESLSLSTGRAVAALILPFAVLVLLVLALAVVAAIVAVAAFSGSF